MSDTTIDTPAIDANAPDLSALLQQLHGARVEIARVVVGQASVVDHLLIALLCNGHVLLEGVPGVGKTLLVRTLGAVTGLHFSRIQFTPDLMPADITGGQAIVPDETTGQTRIEFRPGPIFTQILLADEINRATPKTQSALLEAMQERTATVGGRTMELPKPLLVLATQNPIEMEGTYQLPEAQIDRFLIKSVIAFPTADELDAILDLTTGSEKANPRSVLTAEDVLQLQAITRAVPIASAVRRLVADFVVATQPQTAPAGTPVAKYLRFGVSPRGGQSLILAAKAHALLSGRFNVSVDDLRAVLVPTLRHRFQVNYEAVASGVDSLDLLRQIFADIAGKQR